MSTSKQVKVRIFKMTFSNKVFNNNQKVYIKKTTGQLSFEVVGRRKGKFNYITYWLRFDKDEIKYPKIINIFVPESFAKRLGLEVCK